MSAEDYTILFSCWHSTPECRSRELINSFIVKLLLHWNEIIPCIYYNDLLAVAPALLRFLVTRIRFVCSQITYRHMHARMFWFLMIISYKSAPRAYYTFISILILPLVCFQLIALKFTKKMKLPRFQGFRFISHHFCYKKSTLRVTLSWYSIKFPFVTSQFW